MPQRLRIDMGGPRPPEDVIAERDRRRELAAVETDPNRLVLNDPPPGRSALDQRRTG